MKYERRFATDKLDLEPGKPRHEGTACRSAVCMCALLLYSRTIYSAAAVSCCISATHYTYYNIPYPVRPVSLAIAPIRCFSSPFFFTVYITL